MTLSNEIHRSFNLLLDELLSRKENFYALFERMSPVIHHKDEFFTAFFLGYLAHSYKQLFTLFTNRDMHYEEINETLGFLMENEPRIRAALLAELKPDVRTVPMEEPVESKYEELAQQKGGNMERIGLLEESVDELKREIMILKKVAKNKIARYEVKQAKRGNFPITS
jgi:hypothetical protein